MAKIAGVLERRRSQRFPVELRIQYAWEGKIVLGRSLDVSKTGMRIETEIELGVGQILVIYFGLSPQEGMHNVEAEVMWVRLSETILGMYECGVNFLDAPAESMRALEEIMRTAADDVPLADSRHVIEVDAEPDPSNSDFGDAMRDFEQGRALLAQGHIDLAVDCLRRAASALPPSIEIYEALGEALYLQGDSAGAASAFDQALRLQEESQT